MCGISGIVKGSQQNVSLEEIKTINDLIQHRGPDAEGFYIEGNIALGHRRLSILDLSEASNQPMRYCDDLVITYNGEIFNYLELRDELSALGHEFKTSSDTEVVLASYKEWGIECLKKFNGMWAFAIIDKKARKIFLSRDRFGIKPLYFSMNSGNFVFGSEIKQLLKSDYNLVNTEVLFEYMLSSILNHRSETFFKGVNSLLPGHFLIYDLQTSEYFIQKYYELKKRNYIADFNLLKASGYLSDILESSVNLRLRSDVLVGTALSGGLDSSVISAVANSIYRKNAREKFIAIHAKSIDRETDESSYAKIVSNHLDLDLHTVEPSTEDFINLIDEVAYTQEEPFGTPSMFMGYKVFQKANQLGCKVMLNGQGGDEILLGYERYIATMLFRYSLIRLISNLFLASRNAGLGFINSLLYYFYFSSFRIRKFYLLRRSFLKKDIKEKNNFNELRKLTELSNDISNFQIHEICFSQLPQILRNEDRNSMRHSIEARLPFLDHRLVEAAISFKPEFKIFRGWTKYILRLIIQKRLPNEIVWRNWKLGFNSPDRTWIGSNSEMMLFEVTNSNLLKEITDFEKLIDKYQSLSYKDKWLYYNIAVWERVFKIRLR
jgi:asparagine synthase (glutamine-hydrolysing)